MKKGKLLVLLITVVLLLLVAKTGSWKPEPKPVRKENIPVSVAVMLEGRREQIHCRMDENGDGTIFLPSGVGLSDVVIFPEDDLRVLLDGKNLEKGINCGDFQVDLPYMLSYETEGVTEECTLTFLQSARMPSLYVDVQSGSMDLIHAAKGNGESGRMRLYNMGGSLDYSGRVETIQARGNSSFLRSKKPYSLELAGEGDLLGMGQAKRWILLANAMDPSHLRNKVAYDLAAEAGMDYAPDCRWVDLYLNGNYAGLYLLTERNEVHPQRVDLPESGSFLVSRESEWRLISQNYPHITTDSGAALRIHASGFTEAELQRIWQPVDNAILSEDGIDPLTGKTWQELIDLDSWATEYLMGEVLGNLDSGIISSFFYRDGADPSGKIYAGPVWDYDLSMGSEGAWQLENVQAFFVGNAHVWSLEDTTWFYGLNRKPEFRNRVRELYRDRFRPLMLRLLEEGLEEYAAEIHQSALLDERRWNNGNAPEETEAIRQYLTERLAFLDSVWLENVEYCRVLILLDENSNSLCHAVLPGETVPELPGYEETWDVLGWYDAATEQPFDITQPIYEDTTVYLKRLPKPEEQISRLQIVPIAALTGILVIAVFVDRKRNRVQKNKGAKSITQREIV